MCLPAAGSEAGAQPNSPSHIRCGPHTCPQAKGVSETQVEQHGVLGSKKGGCRVTLPTEALESSGPAWPAEPRSCEGAPTLVPPGQHRDSSVTAPGPHLGSSTARGGSSGNKQLGQSGAPPNSCRSPRESWGGAWGLPVGSCSQAAHSFPSWSRPKLWSPSHHGMPVRKRGLPPLVKPVCVSTGVPEQGHRQDCARRSAEHSHCFIKLTHKSLRVAADREGHRGCCFCPATPRESRLGLAGEPGSGHQQPRRPWRAPIQGA